MCDRESPAADPYGGSVAWALAEFGGVNIHVGPAIDGRDRKRLERLCRYMARPPICQERLSVTESGQVVVRFKNAWRNGAHAVVLDPLDFILPSRVEA